MPYGEALGQQPSHTPPGLPLEVLHVMMHASEESHYNQFCLPFGQPHGLVSFYPGELRIADHVTHLSGDGTVAGFIRTLKQAARELRPSIVHAHGPVEGALATCLHPRTWNLRRVGVYTAHHSYTNTNLRYRNRFLELIAFATFGRVVCVGDASLKSFPKLFRSAAGRRLTAISNGVDIDRVDRVIAEAGQGRQNDGRFLVVSVGRLIPIKDPLSVVRGVSRLSASRVSFVLAGDGPSRGDVERLAGQLLGPDSVSILGAIRRDEVIRLLAKSDVFVSMSKGEGLPIAVLEAMAAGRPVILSDIPSHREIVGGETRLPLVHPGDVSGLADELRRYQQMSPDRRASIGELCRSIVESRFSLAFTLARYSELYSELTGSR